MSRLLDRSRVVGVAFCSAAMVVGSPALAQSEALVVLRGSGLKQVFTAPADEGMARAMGMLSQRLREIPIEISALAQDEEADQAMAMLTSIMPLVAGMLDHPCEFTLIDHGGMANMLPDLDARIVVQTGDRDVTTQMHNAVRFMAQMAAEHEADMELSAMGGGKMMKLTLPMGQFVFGPGNDAETQFVFGLDAAGDGIDMGSFKVPSPSELDGAKLDAQLYVNVKSMARVLTRVMESHGDPNAQQVSETIAQFMPEGDLDIVGGSAIKNGRRWSVLRARGAVTTLENVTTAFAALIGEVNLHPDPISPDAFKLIPQDVTTASVQVQDLSSMVAPLQMVAFQAGLPELVGVIESLGKTWVTYMSDETGGGGLMSLVMIQPDVNAKAMADSLSELANSANLHASVLHGYVRMREWETKDERGGAMKLHSLAFPGLPVPFEVSLGVVDDHLVIGATPQGVLAAVDHWRSGRPSLSDNARFKEASAGLLGNAQKVTFMDMPNNIGRGYPVAQMLGSAVANFVRSPVDPSRDPGVVTPSMRTLARNAKAWIGVTSIQGGDFVFISSGDPSIMVNVAGGAGSLGITPALLGVGVAAAMAEQHGGMNMH